MAEKNKWDSIGGAAIAGLVNKSICAPLERIRLLYQVQGMFEESVKYRTMTHTAKTIWREEGLVGFWRGNGANMLRASLAYCLKFGLNDTLKEKSLRKKERRAVQPIELQKRQAQMSGLPSEEKVTVQLGVLSLAKAGLLAGIVQKCVSYPLDLLTVRIALGVNASTLGEKNYSGIFEAAKRIRANEGWRGFYKGFPPTLFTGAPYVMLQMTFHELFKRNLLSGFNLANEPKSAVMLLSSVAGSMAGVTAQSIVFPGDTVRKRMMTNGVDGRKRLYKNSLDCTMQIYRKEGVLAFYHGLRPMCVRAVPSGAIQFGCFEFFKVLLGYIHQEKR